MKVFLDTSAFAKRYVAEQGSALIALNVRLDDSVIFNQGCLCLIRIGRYQDLLHVVSVAPTRTEFGAAWTASRVVPATANASGAQLASAHPTSLGLAEPSSSMAI